MGWVQVVDDFLRNFLLKMGMSHTLECFETEWYELAATGQLKQEDVSAVPDVYLRNQELDDVAKVRAAPHSPPPSLTGRVCAARRLGNCGWFLLLRFAPYSISRAPMGCPCGTQSASLCRRAAHATQPPGMSKTRLEKVEQCTPQG